ncbi:MAG: phosphatase PAP2 family protein [Solirubrobacterales bacterium]|nr:phosphatase PAP2 family protein [Solirubrobacterales bacterium]MCO5327597.1 phosphatase PAP2 family protein [Solirubrobacterales bacterium]
MEEATRERSWMNAHTASIAGLVVYVIATIILVSADGVLLARDTVFAWLMVGMLMVSLSDLKGWARGVIVDWLPYFGILFLYDFLRGQVGQNPIFEPHLMPQIDFDRFLFSSVPSVSLQERFWDPLHIDALDVAVWAVYMTHFFMVFLISAVLWRVARPKFLEFRAMVCTLSMAAFTTYALFPAVPPWMASDQNAVGPITRLIGNVWAHLGVGAASAIWGHGSDWSNVVAAVPSLHVGFPALILCFFWPTGKWWVRAICLAYVLAMSFALVYAGEHYVFDIVLGWIYALATYVGVRKVRALWASRRERRAAQRADEVPATS